MSYLDAAINKILAMVDKKVKEIEAFRAIVVSTSGGKVQIAKLESTASPGSEMYARVAGFSVAPNDEVLVIPVGSARKYVIVGKLQRTSPTGYTLDSDFIGQNLDVLDIDAEDITADSIDVDLATVDVTNSRSYRTSGGTPSISAGAAAGSTATASIVSGNDSSGVLQVVPSGTGIAAGAIFTLTFNQNRSNSNYAVILAPGSAAARTLGLHLGASSRSTTATTVTTATALTSGQTYQWHYWIVGG